jgi:hypothetical protein
VFLAENLETPAVTSTALDVGEAKITYGRSMQQTRHTWQAQPRREDEREPEAVDFPHVGLGTY